MREEQMYTEPELINWYIELDYLRAQLRHALHHLDMDNLSKRKDMKAKIWGVYYQLDKLLEPSKGESKGESK